MYKFYAPPERCVGSYSSHGLHDRDTSDTDTIRHGQPNLSNLYSKLTIFQQASMIYWDVVIF